MRRALLAGLATTLLLLVQQSHSQSLDVVGTALWAEAFGVEVVGSYAYVTFIEGLMVFDVSDPENTVCVGNCLIHGLTDGIAVRGNYAYALTDDDPIEAQRLDAINISNPGAPLVEGYFAEQLMSASDVIAGDEYLYVVGGDHGLQILDLSLPAWPIEIGRFDEFGGTFIRAAEINGSFAYCTVTGLDGDSLYVIDVSDPTQPAKVGSLSIRVSPWDDYGNCVAASGSLVYAAGSAGLAVVDVSAPSEPMMRGTWSGGSVSSIVTAPGDLLCTASLWDTFRVFDVFDPDEPSMIGSLVMALELYSATNGLVFGVSRFGRSFDILNVSNPTQPELQYSLNTTADLPSDLQVVVNYAYNLSMNRLVTLDVTVPSDPTVVNTLQVTDGNSMALQDPYLYIATSSDLKIVDISNPTAPFVAAIALDQRFVNGVAIQGNYAFVGLGYGRRGVTTLDVQNPLSPVLVDSVNLGPYSKICGIGESHLYVATISHENCSGLQIVDISDPENLALAGYFLSPIWPHDCVAEVKELDAFALVAYEASGLMILNIEDPNNPWLYSGYTQSFIVDLALDYPYLYAADLFTGLYVLDISDLSSPVLVVNDQSGRAAWRVAAANGYIYSASYTLFSIVSFDPTSRAGARPVANRFALAQNHPNPFNATTALNYSLEREAHVQLSVFNLLGQQVAQLVNNVQPEGSYSIQWNAESLPSGIYWAHLESAGNTRTVKMILLK